MLESVLVDLPHGDTTNGIPEKKHENPIGGNSDVVEKVWFLFFLGLEIMQMCDMYMLCRNWEFPAWPSI